MRVRTLAVSLSLTMIIAAGLVAPVAAAPGGCKDWAAAGAELAQNGGLGGLVAPVAQSGPGAVAGLVAGEKAALCK